MGKCSGLSAASALKSVYSGYDKAVTSLAIASHALSSLHGVQVTFPRANAAARTFHPPDRTQDWLLKEAKISQPDFMRRLDQVSPTIPGKAWRLADEMRDDSRMFAAAGLHPGSQIAAADTFERLAHFKDAGSGAVSLAEMGQCLLSDSQVKEAQGS